ncbi:hypothetical protein ACKWTF_004848 [Chironomus riparius]
MMQLGKFFDRINNNNNNNEYVYGENLTIDNKLSLRMKNEEHFDKIDTNYHVKYKNISVYDNEINIIKTTKKQNKVQQKLMKNNRTTIIETSTIIPRQDFESLVSYGNFNTSINSEKESPLDTSIHSSSNGFFKLIFFISIIFIILLLIASIIYIWAIKRYSTNLEHINRRLPEVDHNLLNHSILDLEALMLSVQNLGCAGMERLGNPPSSNSMLASLPSQRDNRSIRHSSIPVMQHDLINSTNGESQSFFKESKSQQLTSGIKYSSHNNCYTNCIVRSNCQMPHIPRPDGDFGRDTLSNHQYHAETTRSYIQAPPNKSIEDVPDASMTSHQLKSMKNCTKSSLKGSDSKKVAEKFKGFFKTISGGTNSNSNPLKSGTDLKTNSNVFTGAMCLSSSKSSNNFPSASTTSSLRGTTQHLHHHHHQQQQHIGTSHDKMTEILKSNDASSTNKMQTSNCINSKEVEEKSISGTSSIQSSSSTTHIDYSSL